jgi:hypothetical protein
MIEFLLFFLLYLDMQNKGANNKSNGKKRIPATKKVAVTSHPQPTQLNFKLVTEAELKSSRNPAYTYLVK